MKSNLSPTSSPDLFAGAAFRQAFTTVLGATTIATIPSTEFPVRPHADKAAPEALAHRERYRAGVNQLRNLVVSTSSPRQPYMPLVRAIRSKSHGYVYRLLCPLSGRVIHLQSRGEYWLFIMLVHSGAYLNVREGFGIPLDLTEPIAAALEIKHPFNRFARANAQMSVDFLLTLQDGTWLAIDYKPYHLSLRPRTQNKYRIMAEAFAAVGVKHLVMTERNLPKALIANLELLHDFTTPVDPQPFDREDLTRAGQVMKALLADGRTTIYQAANACKAEFGCDTAPLVRAALWMIARRHWCVDLNQTVNPDFPVSFLA